MAKNNKLTRYSNDESRVNRHGTHLLELCKAVGMLIINGRLGRDNGIGDFTRVDTTGCSTVDYMICNPSLFQCIRDFAVESKLPESDHRGLSISLNCNVPFKIDTADTQVEWTSQRKYLWSIDDLKELKSIMIDFQSTLFRQNVLNTLVELEDTNRVASAFNEYVTQAVDRVCIISKPTGRVKNKGAPWFDKECRQKRAVAIQAGHRVESIGR